MPEYDPVSKISIVPRGAAGGLTFFAPSEERLESGLYSRNYLENQMAVALGGRIAEELIFGEDDITTGKCRQMLPPSPSPPTHQPFPRHPSPPPPHHPSPPGLPHPPMPGAPHA